MRDGRTIDAIPDTAIATVTAIPKSAGMLIILGDSIHNLSMVC